MENREVTKMIYDIRSNDHAQQTLVNFTGITTSVWKKYVDRESEYDYNIDSLVASVIDSAHGCLPNSYRNWYFVYFHVMTSDDNCASYWQHGILNLRRSYLCCDSGLKKFLDNFGIHIDLDKQVLSYLGREFNITFGDCPDEANDNEAYRSWLVGRKFYYDYTTCGFLSVEKNRPYGGQVHLRPEILFDIDNLLGLDLSQKWAATHKPYKIVVKVNAEQIIHDDASDREIVLSYLAKAYNNAFGTTSEIPIILKNDVHIPPSNILEIKPFKCWQ